MGNSAPFDTPFIFVGALMMFLRLSQLAGGTRSPKLYEKQRNEFGSHPIANCIEFIQSGIPPLGTVKFRESSLRSIDIALLGSLGYW
jgi:hypothetical protein